MTDRHEKKRLDAHLDIKILQNLLRVEFIVGVFNQLRDFDEF